MAQRYQKEESRIKKEYKTFLNGKGYFTQEEALTQSMRGQQGRTVCRILPPEGKKFKADVFIDFAGTTKAFGGVIDCKKNPNGTGVSFYTNDTPDQMTKEYAKTFASQVKERLEDLAGIHHLTSKLHEHILTPKSKEEILSLLSEMLDETQE